MKSEIILSAVGEISDELIAAAEPAQARNTNGKTNKTNKKKKITAWSLSAAAALALIVTGAILLSVLGSGKLGPLTAYDYGYAFSAEMMDGDTNAYKRVYRSAEELKAWGPIPDSETVSVCRVTRNDDQKKHAASMMESIASVWELLYGTRPDVKASFKTASRDRFLEDEVIFEVNPGEGYEIVTSVMDRYPAYVDGCALDFILKSESDGKTVSVPVERLAPDAAERLAALRTKDDALAQFADLIAALQTAAGERFSVVSVRLAALTTTTATSRVTEILGVTFFLSDPAMNAEADPEGSSPTFGSDYFTVSLDLEPNGEVTASVSVNYVKVKYVRTEEKRMSLARAEELLAKNCVFSGYGGCPICQAEQEKISFEDYDAVRLEYRKQNGSATLPVFAFYKLLEKLEPSEYQAPSVYGKDLYAVTCVPAVDVEGIEEYFEELHRYGTVAAMKFAHENADLEIDCLDPLSSLGIDLGLISDGTCEKDQYFAYESLDEFEYAEQVPMFHCIVQTADGVQPEENAGKLEKTVDAFWDALDDEGYSVFDFGNLTKWKIIRKGTHRYLIKVTMKKQNTATKEERAQGIDKYVVNSFEITFTRLDKLPKLDAKVRRAKFLATFIAEEEQE